MSLVSKLADKLIIWLNNIILVDIYYLNSSSVLVLGLGFWIMGFWLLAFLT